MTSTKKRTAAALTAVILTVALAAPTLAAEVSVKSIRVSSYKGSTLEVGKRSGLIIGPSGTGYTVMSSDPDIVAVEQVLTFWVAVAKAEGSAEITASNSAGLTDNLEMRQEMIRLINQTRKANGAPLITGSTPPDTSRP